MYAVNRTIEKAVTQADGRYLIHQELSLVESYAHSYQNRMIAYQEIRDTHKKLVEKSLNRFFFDYPEFLEKHHKRCVYDMSETLRYIALAILKDDPNFFKERLMIWLDSILLAYNKTSSCAAAYHYLQDIVKQDLSSTSSRLIKSYLNQICESLESHL